MKGGRLMITRANKADQIKSIAEKLSRSKAAFLVDFKGLRVEQVTSLRKKLSPAESEMQVVRNTLAKKALEQFPEMGAALKNHFSGTNAIVFAYGDVTASAKVLSTFAKDIELLQLKTGVMDGVELNVDKIKYLSTLPSKEVLRAQFLGLLQAPMSKFVRTLSAVPGGFVRVLSAYGEKQGN
jgi:large subunit ribosomal protein L10